VATAVVMKITIFWDITPCSPLKVNRRFGKQVASRAGLLLDYFLYPEEGGDMFQEDGTLHCQNER
jgi:hypothetical protein